MTKSNTSHGQFRIPGSRQAAIFLKPLGHHLHHCWKIVGLFFNAFLNLITFQIRANMANDLLGKLVNNRGFLFKGPIFFGSKPQTVTEGAGTLPLFCTDEVITAFFALNRFQDSCPKKCITSIKRIAWTTNFTTVLSLMFILVAFICRLKNNCVGLCLNKGRAFGNIMDFRCLHWAQYLATPLINTVR